MQATPYILHRTRLLRQEKIEIVTEAFVSCSFHLPFAVSSCRRAFPVAIHLVLLARFQTLPTDDCILPIFLLFSSTIC